MTEKPEWVPRDELGNYWPSLAGRMPEILALDDRGPPYQIGAGKKAWYLSADVEVWLLAERDRQAKARQSKIKIPKAPNVEKLPKRRTKARATKMDRYLARQA